MRRLWGAFRLRLALDRHMLPVLLAVFLGAGVSTYLAYTYTRNAVEDLARNQIRLCLDFLDHELTIQVSNLAAEARLLSQERVLRLALEDSYLGSSARVAALRKLERYTKDRLFENVFLMNMQGAILLSAVSGRDGKLDLSDRDYYLQAREGRPHLQTITDSRVSKLHVLVASHPVFSMDETVIGVLVTSATTSDFGRGLLDMTRIGRNGGGFILARDNTLLALPSWAQEADLGQGGLTDAILSAARDGRLARYHRHGHDRLCVARVNQLTGWVLVVEADEDEVQAPVTHLAAVNTGVALLTLALVALALNALRGAMSTLRDSEANQRSLTELSPVGIVSFDRDGLPVSMNRQAREILELPPGAPLPDSLPLEDETGARLAGEKSPFETALAGHTSVLAVPAWLVAPSGRRKALNISATPVSGQGNGGFGLVATLEDVTLRRESLERLRQSEERFSKLFRLSPEAALLLEAQTLTVLDVNEAFRDLTGHGPEETLGRTVQEIDFGIDGARLASFHEALLREGHVVNQEFEGRRKDGRTFVAAVSGQGIESDAGNWFMVLLRDVTETKKIHEMMIQTEKMISVGGIAAGIAHEINNPLGIVLQAAQNLVQRTRPDFAKNHEAARKLGVEMEHVAAYIRERKLDVFIQDIQSAALRASGIIRHMLDFSRRSESHRALCDLPAIIDKALALASSDYDLKKNYDFKRIAIEREVPDDLPAVGCTETEIEQVLLNLLRNAAQALAAADPPVVSPRIRIRAASLADRVRVEIEDNGPGIPPDVLKRVFEPFYTTKPPGVGTGLGLSVSYFIVTKGHGGLMRVVSRPGTGACFIIDLPTGEPLEQ